MARRFHKIVEVVDGGVWIEGTGGTECAMTPDGGPLALGIYLLLWHGGLESAEFERGVRYFGPLPNPGAAQLLKTSAVYVGLSETDHETGHPTRSAHERCGQNVPFDRTLRMRPQTPLAHRRGKPACAEQPTSPTDGDGRAASRMFPMVGDMQGE